MEDDDESAVGYFDQVVGAVIVAVHDDAESLRIRLNDGSVIEILALGDGGFDVEVHPPKVLH